MAYNPYVAGGSGNTIEIPGDFPTSMIDDYYRAVVASRQPSRDYPRWWEGLGYGALQYGNQYISDWNKEDRTTRELDRVLQREIEKYKSNQGVEYDYYQQKKAYDDQRELEKLRRQGEASAEIAKYSQPTPAKREFIEPFFGQEMESQRPFNPYDAQQGQVASGPSQLVNTPAEPGGAVEMKSDDRKATPQMVKADPYIMRTEPEKRPDMAEAYAQLASQNPLLAGVYADMLGVQGRTNMLDPNARAARDALTFQRTQSGNLSGVRAQDIQTTQPGRVEQIGAQTNVANSRAARNFADAAKLLSVANTNQLRLEIINDILDGVYGDPNSPAGQQILAIAGGRPSYTPRQQTEAKVDPYIERGLPPPGTQTRSASHNGPRLSANDQMLYNQALAEVRRAMPSASEDQIIEMAVKRYQEKKAELRNAAGGASQVLKDALAGRRNTNLPGAKPKNSLVK